MSLDTDTARCTPRGAYGDGSNDFLRWLVGSERGWGKVLSAGADRPLVCEWLFPTWSSPCGLVAVLAVRFCLHGGLVAVAADARGWPRPLPLALSALAVLSAGLAVGALRPGGLGERAGDVDLLLQLVALALAGVAVAANPSKRRVIAAVGLGLAVLVVGFFTMIAYAEMFVAP